MPEISESNLPPRPETLHLDVTPAMLKDISVGDKLTVTVTGTVLTASTPTSRDKKQFGDKPSIRMEVSKKKIVSPNAFSQLASDDDED